MGVWGPGIYSNDTASDVRDMCQEIFPFVNLEEGNKIIFEEYKDMLDMNLMDDDYASFWYALADWQWKHGMLTDEIRDKTLKLLENYTGLSEWEADASKAKVKKRKDVLDKLKEQLLSPQPPLKKTKANLMKPKHKPGDIIIFRLSEKKCEYNPGIKYRIKEPWLYQSDHIRNDTPTILPDPFDGTCKYYAILCVGTYKKLYSQYIPNIYDEYSVYAFYDYCSIERPTLRILTECGFLPQFINDYDSNTRCYINTGWTYVFYTMSKFNYKDEKNIDHFDQLFDLQETARFCKAVDEKQYFNKPTWELGLTHAFSDFHDEKLRSIICGFEIDTLLNSTQNPKLLKQVAQKKY